MIGLRSRRVARGAFALAAVVALVWAAGVRDARADHSLGRSCLSCHALRSTKVVAGSRNILADNVVDALYQTDFYCGPTWDGGEPLDCAYCHVATGDIGNEIQTAAGGANGSAHPVRVAGDNASYTGSVRILCNDCHNGDTDNATNPGPDLTPQTACTKATGDGYPNHHSLVLGATDPGSNDLADNPPRLTGPYGPQGGAVSSEGGVDWTGGTDGVLDATELVCFICHDGDAGTDPPFSSIAEDTAVPPANDGTKASNIAYAYNLPGGGHNLEARGSVTGKLPCYDCHDPHAAGGTSANAALVINGLDTPANPYGTSDFSTTGYDGTNDRVVCYGCHDGTYTVEGVTPPDPATTAPVFPYHADVHANVGNATQNCLQNNGGCHQGPHNTNFFRCLDCHSTARDPNSDPSLANVDHVDSEFGHIGSVTDNALQSFHSINYDVALDMTIPDNNGCLKCHDTRTGPADAILKDDDGNFYTGSRANNFTTRESLKYYDQFCISCHDGTGNDSEFTVGFSYQVQDPDYGTVTFPGGTMLPPQVTNRTGTNWNLGYFYSVGHGRGNGGTGTTTPFDPSGNTQAKIPCLECHLYHGSTAYKLMPGWQETADGKGHVVKGATYPRETVGTKFSIGGVSDSKQIDYTDYTDDTNNPRLGNTKNLRSWYVSDYTNTAPWSTYYYTGTIQVPEGTTTHFGTAGDVQLNNQTLDELACGQDATTGGGAKVGFCNTCHLYQNSTDGTNETYGWVYTHEGMVGLTDCDGNDLKSQMDFFKDCVECHDPHGSGEGRDSASSPANIYMVRRKIKHAPTQYESDLTVTSNWSAVVFENVTGTDSFDEADTDNSDDLCTVCHQSPAENTTHNVDHNYRSLTTANHNEGTNCTQCHPHGGKKSAGTTNLRLIGFPQAACNGCHGFPPAPSGRALEGGDANLVAENYAGGGGAHIEHVRFLQAKFPASDNAKELCGPCHGDNAASGADHAASGELDGAWSIGSRAFVNLEQRTQGSWDGMAGDPATGAYGGNALPTTPPGDAVDQADSTCTGVDCHGNPPAAEALYWNLASLGDGTGDSDGEGRSRACAGCHDGLDSQAEIRLYDRNGASVYTSKLAPDAARVYYTPPSGYSRGGHGDAAIQSEDPFIDSAPGVTTPIDCTACHDNTLDHFPAAAATLHRLRTQTLQAATDANGLCTRCHTGYNDTAPNGNPLHHPSGIPFTRAYQEPTGVNYDVPAGGEGDVDEFVMYWADTTYTAVGSPSQVDLPRLDDIFPGQSVELACTTCHQPHGTDLAVDVGTGGGNYTEIPDNNMLRLRDTDSTLCEACH